MKELTDIENLKQIQKELKKFDEIMKMLKKVKLTKKEYGLAFPYEHCVSNHSLRS